MSPKDNTVYVDNKEQFYSSRLVQDAVTRNLQVMAESSQHLAETIKQEHPDIPWKNISTPLPSSG